MLGAEQLQKRDFIAQALRRISNECILAAQYAMCLAIVVVLLFSAHFFIEF